MNTWLSLFFNAFISNFLWFFLILSRNRLFFNLNFLLGFRFNLNFFFFFLFFLLFLIFFLFGKWILVRTSASEVWSTETFLRWLSWSTECLEQLVDEWNLWDSNSLTVNFKRVLFLIVYDGENLVWSLSWVLYFQKWMIMCWLNFTSFTKIEVGTHSALISDTFNILVTTLVTSNVLMNNFLFSLWSFFGLNFRFVQKLGFDFFHELWHHFFEFLFNISFSNVADLAFIQWRRNGFHVFEVLFLNLMINFFLLNQRLVFIFKIGLLQGLLNLFNLFWLFNWLSWNFNCLRFLRFLKFKFLHFFFNGLNIQFII